MSSKTCGLALLATLSPLVTVFLFWDSLLSEVLLVLASVLFPSALMAISRPPVEGRRAGGRGGPGLPFLLAILLAVSAAGILLTRGQADESGLPLAAYFELAGLWLIPLPVVVIAYLREFDREILPKDALDNLRRRYGGR